MTYYVYVVDKFKSFRYIASKHFKVILSLNNSLIVSFLSFIHDYLEKKIW